MKNQLTLIIRYISTSVSGCLLMMWGVMNLTNQVRTYSDSDPIPVGAIGESIAAGWVYSWALAIVFSVLPFAVGIVLVNSVFQSANRAKQL